MLRVITYHRVDTPARTPHLDPKIISATPDAFAQHMRYLAESFNVISMHDLLDCVENGTRLPRNAIMITFDDAYCDVREFALPILKQYKLPATVFVPTAYPDNNKMSFWWDRIYNAVMSTSQEQITLAGFGEIALDSELEKQQGVRRIQGFIKTLPHSKATETVDFVCDELVSGKPLGKTVLSWEELRDLTKEGITLGAHTQTHPLMTQLTPEQLRSEVAGAQSDLKSQLDETLPIFCYPNGSHNDDVVEVLREEGFKLAFTVNDGHNNLAEADLFRLRRTNITRKSTLPVFKLRLKRWFTYVDMFRHRTKGEVSRA